MDSGIDVFPPGSGDHSVLFYREDDDFAGQVSEYLLSAIRARGAAVVIATPAHRALFEARLARAGVDVAAARARGSYLALDANETMRRFLVADWPDAGRFWQVISPVIRQAIESGQPVHAFGEMVALLWEAGLVNAAIEVEAMWNELGSQYPFSLLCAYPVYSGGDDQHDELAEICHLHTRAIGVRV